MRKSKNSYFYHIFVSPGGRPPGTMIQYLAWMKRQLDAYKSLAACIHLSLTVSQLFEPQVQKISYFRIPQPTFLFPLETPLRL